MFAVALGEIAVCALAVFLSIRLAFLAGLVDVPNERSSHSLPTPRTGGVPMAATAMAAFLLWGAIDRGRVVPHPWAANALYFCVAMTLLGFLDDLFNLPPLYRFLAQITGAFLVVWPWGSLSPVVRIVGHVVPPAVWIPVAAVWIVWMMNLYNFMDGIDGLAGGEAVLASAFFFLVFEYFGESVWAAANLFVAAAAAGFLVFNWPPARVFMGDGGSGFLGAFYGVQAAVAHVTTPVPFPVLVLPFANFVLDTTITLVRRILRGERWYQAHRRHFYQRATNIGFSHKKTTSLELSIVMVSCIAAAACIEATPGLRVAVSGTVAVLVILIGGWIARRERALNRNGSC